MGGSRRFVGERLKEARESLELTATALAIQLEVSKQSVSKFESGVLEPSAEVVQKMGQVLRLPQHYFYRPIEAHEQSGVLFWRSTSAATVRARKRAARRFAWLRIVTRYLSRFVQFPALDFPAVTVPDDPVKITATIIENAATEVRRHWSLGDGPISNVSWLLENKGVIVARHDFDTAHLDAFSEWHEGRHPYVVLSADKESAARSRFDAAHELGHLVLHRHVSATQFNTKTIHAEMERQANLFASAFLLPAQTFSASFYSASLDALVPLKSQWQVSIGAMISRAAQLNLISEFEERRMWINLNRRNWRKREPLDDQLIPEEPRFLVRALELIVSNGLSAPGELSIHLGLSERIIEEVLGLEIGYLSKGVCPPVRLKDEPEEPETHILRFPTAQ